ncbi:MAG: N-acetylneuraminate synthase family protein, partial [Elusimicrobiota bacterium]
MDKTTIFDNLFVFDMANNHQGNVEHGRKIISAISEICKEKNIKGVIKFQYRHLNTFIHPDYRNATTPKHILRFLNTRLTEDEFKILVDDIKRNGLITMCTPFDEESVTLIEHHEIEIIKIASCSAQDWPLLERIAIARKPVVCST